MVDILRDQFDQIRQRHNRSGYDEIEFLLLVLHTLLDTGYIRQTDTLGYIFRHTNLLADRVYERKMTLRKEYRQRNTRKTATCADIKNVRTRSEMEHLSYRHRVIDMVFHQIIYILAGVGICAALAAIVYGLYCFFTPDYVDDFDDDLDDDFDDDYFEED